MKLLITGANGQLGQALQTAAAQHTAEITAADIDSLDITNLADVRRFVQAARPDAVINCAAYTNVDKCETDYDAAFRVNTLGARNLAIAAQDIQAKVVHISTDYVFDGTGSAPYRECDIPAPQSVYGYTKLLGEQYVRDFCRRYFIVRTAWLYGKCGANFVKTILKAAREKGAVKVVNDQRGNPTNAADLAQRLLLLTETEEYGVYHCTSSGECSWYEFAREFIRLSALPCEVTPCTTAEFPRPAKRPAYSVLDNGMLRQTLGGAMPDWHDAIARYMREIEA